MSTPTKPQDDYVTTALYVGGHELRFFAPASDAVAIAATLLTWVRLKTEASGLLVTADDAGVDENTWYDRAHELYKAAQVVLSSDGLGQSEFDKLKDEYFGIDRAPEIQEQLRLTWGLA